MSWNGHWKLPMQDILGNLKDTKRSQLKPDIAIYIYISYRYSIKHLYNIQIQKYIVKQENYTELCTNEIQMACNSY